MKDRQDDREGSASDPSAAKTPLSRTGRDGFVVDAAQSGSTGADYLGAEAFPRGSADSSTLDGSSADLPIHALPDAPRPRGPFGASTLLHILLLALLVTSGLVKNETPAPPPPLTIALQEPQPTAPKPPISAMPKPSTIPRDQPSERKKAEPRPVERQPVTPPPPPKLPPPATPLPAPTRMGEMVPVPHYPVPGTVPPEKAPAGKAGASLPENAPERKPSGVETGTSETDPGVGNKTGPGAGGATTADSGVGVIRGEQKGGLIVPRLRGGALNLSKDGPEGGGKRRGMNMQLPPDVGGLLDFDFEDKDYDWSDYRSQMYWAIWRSWMNRLHEIEPALDRFALQQREGICSNDSPNAGKSCRFPGDAFCGHSPIYNEPQHVVVDYTPGECIVRLLGTTVVRFVIERSGTISTIQVLDPSAIPLLDQAAQDGLKEAVLPRLPEDFDKDSEGVTARFIVEVQYGPGFKEYMGYLKARGIF